MVVVGDRNDADEERVWRALDGLHAEQPITLVVHGAAMVRQTGELVGVDLHADTWARVHWIKVEPHPPDWLTWSEDAEAMRTRQMIGRGAHLVLLVGDNRVAIEAAERLGVCVRRLSAN